MLEVTKNAPQMAIVQLGDAFKNFRSGRAEYPKFRKKGVHEGFTLTNDQFSIDDSRIRIPKRGWVRMRESLRFTGKIMSATLSRGADKWFAGITVDTEDSPKRRAENQGATGVDLGVSAWATLSAGEKVAGPKPHRELLERQRRLSRSLSRKHKAAKAQLGLAANAHIPKGMRLPVSENAKKAGIRLSGRHARIANIRKEVLHKPTSESTRRIHTACIEDLNVRGMLKNHGLARSIADMSFFEFRRPLEYKTERRGGMVVVADRRFPSRKTCSSCATIQDEISPAVREWTCADRGTTHDRDGNAARNLLAYGWAALSRSTASCAECEARGEEGSGPTRKRPVKPASMKQEVGFVSV